MGFFVAAAVALVTHKCTLIALHRPLPVVGVLCLAPFIFIFDALALIVLHKGLSTTSSLPWRILAMMVSVVIISCSATFVSLYLEAKAELDWERALEVNPIRCLADCRSEPIGKFTVRSWHKGEAVSVTHSLFTLYAELLLLSRRSSINALIDEPNNRVPPSQVEPSVLSSSPLLSVLACSRRLGRTSHLRYYTMYSKQSRWL